MPYIGNTPADKFLTLAKQNFSTSATTSYTLDSAVSSTQDIALFINSVRQSPVDAYTVSGTALTLTSATSGTDEMYCVYLGKTVGTVSPSANSITNAMMTDDSVGLAELSATGTPSSSNFLRGDNAWATPTGNGKILQVVQNTTTTTTTLTDTTTLTLVTDLNVAITPSATSSKILVMMSCGGMIKGVTNAMRLDMLRDTTTVVSRNRQAYYSGGATDWIPMPFHLNYLDSPSTTSATTYTFKVSMGASSSTGTQINPSGGTASGSVIAMEVGA